MVTTATAQAAAAGLGPADRHFAGRGVCVCCGRGRFGGGVCRRVGWVSFLRGSVGGKLGSAGSQGCPRGAAARTRCLLLREAPTERCAEGRAWRRLPGFGPGCWAVLGSPCGKLQSAAHDRSAGCAVPLKHAAAACSCGSRCVSAVCGGRWLQPSLPPEPCNPGSAHSSSLLL